MALALFAMAALPVCAAFAAYFFWVPAKGMNYGVLVGPLKLPDAQIAAPDGSRFSVSDLRGSWVLVQIDGGRCSETCAKRLFLMRQVRLMQGREMGRVERLWLVADDVAPDPDLVDSYKDMRVGRAAGAFMQLFPAGGDPRGHIYVIDPLGHVMLRFPREPDPSAVSRDLSRLLKVSHVG